MPRRYLNGSLAVLDHELAFLAVAEDFAATLGWAPRDLVGVSSYDVTDVDGSPDARASHAYRMRILGAGGTVDNVSTLVARDGARIRYGYSLRSVNGGEMYVASGEPLSAELLEPPPSSPLIGEWLTKAEAAAYAKVSESTLERAVNAGELEVGGTRGRRRFKRGWLDAWLVGLGALLALIALLVALCVLADIDVHVVAPFMGPAISHHAAPSTDDARPKLGMPARRVDNDALERATDRA